MTTTKRISPALLPPLKEALLHAFWYKVDLRAFVSLCLPERQLVAQLDWSGYKRNVIAVLVDTLASDQHKHFDSLLNLLIATADLADPTHLKSLEDGVKKYNVAVDALASLRSQTAPLRHYVAEKESAARRRDEERVRHAMKRGVAEQREKLKYQFFEIVKMGPQERGYALEKFLNALFDLFELNTRSSFRIAGEQIDGSFSHEGVDFIFEARWRDAKSELGDLDSFAGKIGRKLDNTLCLFLSMNGFEQSAVDSHSTHRPVMILMTGGDLMAVLDDRIDLPALIARKRRHAAQTGSVLVEASTLLS